MLHRVGDGVQIARAMDSFLKNRRGTSAGPDPEMGDVHAETAYQTALSQTGSGDPTAATSGSWQGEASPGAEEAAKPVASPFHSQRAQAEIDLLRSQPSMQDQDAEGDFSATPVRVARLKHRTENRPEAPQSMGQWRRWR